MEYFMKYCDSASRSKIPLCDDTLGLCLSYLVEHKTKLYACSVLREEYDLFDEMKEGTYKSYYRNGYIHLKCEYHRDMLHGIRIEHSEHNRNIVIKQSRYTYDFIDCDEVEFDDDGILTRITPYRFGVTDGELVHYNTSGDITMICEYIVDNKCGVEIAFHQTGIIQFIKHYLHNKLHGEQLEFNEHGQLTSLNNYINGNLHGESYKWTIGSHMLHIEYHDYDRAWIDFIEIDLETNNMIVNFRLIDNKCHGDYLIWDKHGNLLSCHRYEYGHLHGPYYQWYRNGNIKYIAEFFMHMKIGPEYHFDVDGNLIRETIHVYKPDNYSVPPRIDIDHNDQIKNE